MNNDAALSRVPLEPDNGWVENGWYVSSSLSTKEGVPGTVPHLCLMARTSGGEVYRRDFLMTNEQAVQIAEALLQQASPPLVPVPDGG